MNVRGPVFAVTGMLALTLVTTGAAAVAQDEGPITTINGEVPPGELLPLQDVVSLLDTIDGQGNHLVVTRGTREPGTRVGIHVHGYGGYTCVLSGVITDFVEGKEPAEWPAGTCYYMPPDTPMSAANLGTEPAVLIDNFTVPPGEPTITILEPGWPEEG